MNEQPLLATAQEQEQEPEPELGSNSNGVIIISPRISPTPTPPPSSSQNQLNNDYDQGEGELASARELFFQSILNGQTSRSRRGLSNQPSRTVRRSIDHLQTGSTREQQQGQQDSEEEEEDNNFENQLRALRELRRLRNELQIRIGEQEQQEQQEEQAEQEEEQVETSMSTGTGIWRNEPIPVPRISNLPRGGRTIPSSSASTSRQIFSPPPPPPPVLTPWVPPIQQSPPNNPSSSSSSSLFNLPSFTRMDDLINRASEEDGTLFPPRPPPRPLPPRPPTITSNRNTSEEGRARREGGGGVGGPGREFFNLRSFFLPGQPNSNINNDYDEPVGTHLIGESFMNDQDEEVEVEETRQQIWEGFNNRERDGREGERTREFFTITRGEEPPQFRSFTTTRTLRDDPNSSSSSSSVRREVWLNDPTPIPPPNRIIQARTTGELPSSSSSSITVQRGGRSREETNSLSGRLLRSKKQVYLIYCGGGDHDEPLQRSEEEEEESLPKGFTNTNNITQKGGGRGRGCGVLLCSRGLIQSDPQQQGGGVSKKVFTDSNSNNDKVEIESCSSDLPPSFTWLTDLEEQDQEGLGERIGKRGWKNCKSCITRDLGCKRCGNHVGYRLLRPDVYCSIARDPSSSSASSSSSSSGRGPWRRINESARIGGSGGGGGGVTGGGVVDGFLFHFRKDRIRVLNRRIGLQPELEIENEINNNQEEEEEEGKIEPGSIVEEEQQRGGRLIEKIPKIGEKMLWKHIPTPQRDFQSGLISEPLDWLTPNQETWWLENSISKHSYNSINGTRYGSRSNRGSNSRRSGERGSSNDNDRKRTREEEEEEDHSTDTLSSATTTIRANSGFGSGASLSRSHALRLRVPLASPSTSTSTSTSTSSVANYDRYRSDAQQYARRVRQRLDDTTRDGQNDRVGEREAAGAGMGGVVGSLERAGYGSWYEFESDSDEAEEEEEEEAESRGKSRGGKTRVRARQSVGR
ncbi:hypothetical protein JCM3765_006226 [Sporobolomyces pararoseus]